MNSQIIKPEMHYSNLFKTQAVKHTDSGQTSKRKTGVHESLSRGPDEMCRS